MKQANWEVSYDRFAAGEHPHTIAVTQGLTKEGKEKKGILPATVVGHLLDAALSGRDVDLFHLKLLMGEDFQVPNEEEWRVLEEGQNNYDVGRGIDVVEVEEVKSSELFKEAVGELIMNTEYSARTEEMKVKYNKWSNLVRTFMLIKRLGIKVDFEGDETGGEERGAKRAKM